MIKHNQDGAVNGLALSLGFAVLLLVGAVIFGGWAASSRADYKNNSDAKVAAAVTLAKQQESTTKDKQFAEAEKQPLRTYSGPEAYGSLVVNYPKTWSGYVDDKGTGAALVDGYFYPVVVPSITAPSSVFALRLQVLNQGYAAVVKALSAQPPGKVSITAYALPKVPKVVGVQVTGALPNQKTGVMIVLPLRDKTLEISTEGSQFVNDFNANILPNFSFSP